MFQKRKKLIKKTGNYRINLMGLTSENQLAAYKVPDIPFVDEIRADRVLFDNLQRQGFSDVQIENACSRLMVERQFLNDSGLGGLLEKFYSSHFENNPRVDGYDSPKYCFNFFPFSSFISGKRELQTISMLDLLWRENGVAKRASAGVVCGNYVWGHYSEKIGDSATSDLEVLRGAMQDSTAINYPLSSGYFMDENLFDAVRWQANFALERNYAQYGKSADIYPFPTFLNLETSA